MTLERHLAKYFGAPGFGEVLVYGADGRIVANLDPPRNEAIVARALERAAVRIR